MALKVVIDPGHGGSDPGAVAFNTKEKDLALDISKYMYNKFKELGIPVAITRTTDESLDTNERINRILNAFGNSDDVVVISNHINSDTSGNAEGAEVIYALRNNSNLANNILTSLGSVGQTTRSAFQRRLPSNTAKDYYFIHRNTGNTEPLIVEYGFINNEKDLNKIKNNYQKYADAVIDGVLRTKTGKGIELSTDSNYYIVKSGDTFFMENNFKNIT